MLEDRLKYNICVIVYTKVCEKCKCDGEEGIHYEKLRQPAETVNECFKLAASNPFCGDMIVRDDSTTCYCRRIGESDTCTQIETYANWAVYKAFSSKHRNFGQYQHFFL